LKTTGEVYLTYLTTKYALPNQSNFVVILKEIDWHKLELNRKIRS